MADVNDGVYKPNNHVTVTTWKAPDKDGPGELMWFDRKGPNGEYMGRDTLKDDNHEPVKGYPAPRGFQNVRDFEGNECWVRVDGRGQIIRTANGQAIEIKPGTTLVEYPDGSFKLLTDEYDHWLFSQTHTAVATNGNVTPQE